MGGEEHDIKIYILRKKKKNIFHSYSENQRALLWSPLLPFLSVFFFLNFQKQQKEKLVALKTYTTSRIVILVTLIT